MPGGYPIVTDDPADDPLQRLHHFCERPPRSSHTVTEQRRERKRVQSRSHLRGTTLDDAAFPPECLNSPSGPQVMLEERQRGCDRVKDRSKRVWAANPLDVLWLRRSAPRPRVTIRAGSAAASLESSSLPCQKANIPKSSLRFDSHFTRVYQHLGEMMK